MNGHAYDGHAVQVENGNFTQIQNVILEAFGRVRLTGSEFRAVHFLLRKTYGYHKREDAIALSQWTEGTDVDKGQIAGTLKALLAKHVIYCRPGPYPSTEVWGFNSNLEQWDASLFRRRPVRQHSPRRPTPADHALGRQLNPEPLLDQEPAHNQNPLSQGSKNVELVLNHELELKGGCMSCSSMSIEPELNESLSWNSTTKEKKETNKRKGRNFDLGMLQIGQILRSIG